LKSLTRFGFLWLPGLKYTHNGTLGDLDIVASCDGHLVFAECKNLEATSIEKVPWDDLFSQLQRVADIASVCEAKMIVFASLIETYPQHFDTRVQGLRKSGLEVLLLNKKDLDKGYRQKDNTRVANLQLFKIDDFIRDEPIGVPLPVFNEPRVVETNAFVESFGSVTGVFGDATERLSAGTLLQKGEAEPGAQCGT
jgi:hypothetical protein